MKSSRWLSFLVVVALVLALLYVSRSWWLTQAASWLVYSRETDRADAIFVLGGDASERPRHAADLYRKGVSPRLITTGEPVPRLIKAAGLAYTEAELSARVLKESGVPSKAISVINQGNSTYDEAVIARRLARQRGYKKILVVSSPYHMRRAYLTFSKVFQGSGVDLYFSHVQRSWYRVQNWWQREEETLAVFEEYVKLARYAYLYLLRSAPAQEPAENQRSALSPQTAR